MAPHREVNTFMITKNILRGMRFKMVVKKKKYKQVSEIIFSANIYSIFKTRNLQNNTLF